jgi:predicted transcriptional regulator
MKMPEFMLRGFLRPRELVVPALGKLERAVMEEVWKRQEVSVREMHVAFDERLAYTTLMTTFDRLYRKGLLDRRKSGRAFVYAARVTREELEQGVAEDVIDSLLGRNANSVEPILACIVETVSERDRELLDALDQLVKEKKRELQGREK